jgi:hypothetical protein
VPVAGCGRSRGRWRSALALALSVTHIGAALAEQPTTEAQGHVDRGMALYAAKAFREAADELAAAYALDARRETLFAQAQATRLAGDCAAALPLYERFLAASPPPQQVEATRIAMGRCQVAANGPGAKALAAAPTVIAQAAPPAAVVVSPAADLHPRGPPFYRDWKGNALVAGGVVVAAVGVVLMSTAAAMDTDARTREVLGDYAELHQGAERRWRIGLGAAVAGGLLVAGGAGRYLWVSSHGAGVRGRF